MSDLSMLAVSPYVVLAATAVIVMLASTFTRSHGLYVWMTSAGLAAAFAFVLVAAGSSDRRATALLRMDDYALYFIGLTVVITGVVVFLSYGYLRQTERQRADYYVLLTLAALGAAVLVASTHFASLFLGLEILSVSLYGLISYPRGRPQAVEAGLKYLVLAAGTAAFLLFGMALVYTVTGAMYLDGLAAFTGASSGWEAVAYRVGLALIFAGIGFKLALVPFHMWTPDVYQGAPAPVTAFVATVSKGAVFVLLLRFIRPVDLAVGGILFTLLSAVAYGSMIVGNLLALSQNNIKRLLAYSSIAHLGYLLVALLAGGGLSRVAVAFYLSVYSVSLATAFGVITILSKSGEEAERLEVYRGLSKKRPFVAAVLTISLLSLAGIPVTAGFLAKFFVVKAGAEAALWGLLITLAITSAMSLFYYLRVILVMFGSAVTETHTEQTVESVLVRKGVALPLVTVSALTVITLVLGVYPEPLLRLIDRVVSVAGG